MKTVADIAKELEVTPKTIYQRLNRVKPGNTKGNTGFNPVTPGNTGLNRKNLTEKHGGITFVTSEGEDYLREIYSKVKPGKTQKVKEVTPGYTGFNPANEQIAFLKAQLERVNQQNDILQSELNREREHSRAQADRLSGLAEQLAELNRNNQVLLGSEQTRTHPALLIDGEEQPQEGGEPRKKGFWNIFKKS